MTKLMLPKGVVAEDVRLTKQADDIGAALAAHRWHWTLDESNPKRVTFAQYARETGPDESVIRAYAHAHEMFVQPGTGRTFNDCYELAKMGTETAVVTEAIAKQRGISVQQVRKTRPEEVRRVREVAREYAEKRGTSVEEEAPRFAELVDRVQRIDRENEEKRRKRHSFAWITVTGTLGKARRNLAQALKEIEGVEFTDEEVELLTDSIDKVKAVIGLIEMRLTGEADVDWDAELAKLTSE